jgi:hypothetical protein
MGDSPQINAKNAVVDSSITLAVTAGTTTASSGDLLGRTVVGLITPTIAGGSTSITFTVSDDNSTFRTFRDKDNADYTITVDSTSRQYYIDPAIFAGVRYLKAVFDQSETETLTLVTRPLL